MIKPLIILLCFFHLTAIIPLCAADTLYLDKGKTLDLVAGQNYSYLVDPNGNFTIEDVVNSEFKTALSDVDWNDAYEAPIVWVKLVIKNISEGSLSSFLYWEPNGQAYIEEDSVSFIKVPTGSFLPFSMRNQHTTDPLIEIVLSGHSSKTVYLRIEQTEESFEWFGNLDASIIESGVWVGNLSDRNWEFGIFFGILFFIVVYNLIFYFTLRDRSYLMYVFFIACTTLVWANANNLTFRFIFPESTSARLLTININYFCMSIGSIFYLFFTMYYLRTKELLPRWHKVLKVLVGVAAVLFVIGCVVSVLWHNQIGFTPITMSTVLFTLVSIFVAAASLRKRYSPAWYFIFGNGVFCITLFFAVTHLLPTNVLFGYITLMQAGTLVQVSLFSIGLAKRISVIRDDREKAQEEVIGQLKVNEELKTQVTRELEQKVSERTFELSEQKKIVEGKNKDILDSITYAKRLQEAILPSLQIWHGALKDSFVFYLPKDIVAGDFYWMEKRDNVVYVAAADCTGHGVPGAMVSVVCSNALHRAFTEFAISDPGKLLDKVRQLVVETFSKSADQVRDGMDISLARIDLKSREVSWAGANNPLWYVKGGNVNEIKGNKQPIGVTDSPAPFTTHLIQLEPGDLIYLFTDGFADQFGGPKGKKFKYKPLQELVLSMATKPMKEQEEVLLEQITSWRGDLEQIDDICILGIHV